MSYTSWKHPKRKKKSVKKSAAAKKAWRTRKRKYGKSGAPKRSKGTPWYLTESQARRRKKAAKKSYSKKPAWQREWQAKERARAKDKTYQSLKASYERAATYYDAAFTREAKKMGVNLQHTMRRSTIDEINAKIRPLYEESRRAYRALVTHKE